MKKEYRVKRLVLRDLREKTTYQIAKTRKDLEASFRLVYDEYVNRGYIPKHYKSRLRISLHNALPATTTFVAKNGERIVATVTLIPDSRMGLPMDKIYKRACNKLRKKKKRIAEVSQLSIDSKLFQTGWFSMFNFSKLIFIFRLFKLVFDYARRVEKLDELCIAVNPRHQRLYKFLFFEQMGGLKYYGSVNKAPAVALHLDMGPGLKKIGKQRMALWNIFYGKETNPEAFKNKFVMKERDLEYFFVQKSDLLKKATKEQLKYIRSLYAK